MTAGSLASPLVAFDHDSSVTPDPLTAALVPLDRLLASALARHRGAESGDTDRDTCAQLLAALRQVPAMAWLADTFSLDSIDLTLAFLALAPEIDLAYQHLFTVLQGDPRQERLTIALATELLREAPADAGTISGRLAHACPLRAHTLLLVESGITGANTEPAWLARTLRIDPQIAAALLGHARLDERLVGVARYVTRAPSPRSLTVPAVEFIRMTRIARAAHRDGTALRLVFAGPPGSGRRAAAAALASHVEAPLLEIDMIAILATTDPLETLRVALREARFGEAIPYLPCDAVPVRPERPSARSPSWGAICRVLDAHLDVAIIAVSDAAPMRRADAAEGSAEVSIVRATGVTQADVARLGAGDHLGSGGSALHLVRFGMPGTTEREALWRLALHGEGIHDLDDAVPQLAERFRLLPAQVHAAARAAANTAAWRAASDVDSAPTSADLYAAARAESGGALAALATRIAPAHLWRDLVLPADALTQLRELCARASGAATVFEQWGFGARLPRARGVHALFAGPSGTGKTMAAEVLAHELGVDLFRVDLSAVVSKYIGETEKNLERVFTAAEGSNGILFFDEADALFGRRTEGNDALDRYANVEVSYLLQRMEAYDGIAVLATNLRAHLDEAFLRRLTFAVHFPFPDQDSRRTIWQGIWPADAPLSSDVDLDFLASAFELSGGNIRNVAVASAFLAAAEDSAITMSHLLRAIAREYQKLGKQLGRHDWGVYAELMAQ